MLTLFLSGLGSDSIHTLCIGFAFSSFSPMPFRTAEQLVMSLAIGRPVLSFCAKANCSARYGSCYTSESMFLGMISLVKTVSPTSRLVTFLVTGFGNIPLACLAVASIRCALVDHDFGNNLGA